jgi:hypothetical protein
MKTIKINLKNNESNKHFITKTLSTSKAFLDANFDL